MMLAASDAADPGQRGRFFDGLARATHRAHEQGCQAVVLVSNEHFTNFFLENFPQLCVGMGEQHTAPVERWLGLEPGQVPGHPTLARQLTDGLIARSFEPSFSHKLRLDHGVISVYERLSPDMTLPLVPILQNCAVPPMPSLRRSFELGVALREALEDCDAVERVALVATGGLSHWVGHRRSGDIDTEFDRWFLDRVSRQSFDDVLDIPNDELEMAGNGAHEIRSWLTLAGATTGRTPSVLAYEPIRPWLTGMAVVEYV